MANYWAIAIGINQYQSFQPLIYAQRDAQLFRDFLITEGGFEADHCLLMTDGASAPDHVAYPSRGNIQARMVQICQQILRPGDLLWCFFSGYGVQFQGKDYLMPVDSDPLQVEATGIPMESIYRLLNAAPTDNIIMVLDINRSQSTFAGEGVGAATAALAKQYGIATLLSCRPEQFSHETLALRQGLVYLSACRSDPLPGLCHVRPTGSIPRRSLAPTERTSLATPARATDRCSF